MFLLKSKGSFKDVKLFLWLIPCINAINYYLTYIHFGPLWKIVLTFTIDTAQGYAAWLVVRSQIIWLDTKIPYNNKPLKRIIIQLVLTTLTGAATIIFLTELENWLATSQPVPRSFYTTDILIISIWFFVVNGIYICMHYYQQWQESEQQRKKETEIKTGGFPVSTSKKDLILPFEEILGFFIDGDYSVLITTESKKLLVDTSLDKVEKKLPDSAFFRLNRQYIVHRQLVNGYEKLENGKLSVLLKENNYLPVVIQVSRTKAPGFKTWLLPS